MDVKSEVERLQREVSALRRRKSRLESTRQDKLDRFKLQLQKLGLQAQNIPEGFAAEHPVITEALGQLGTTATRRIPRALEEAAPVVQSTASAVGSALKGAGQFLYENQLRYNLNRAFAAGLQVGETRFNPATGRYVTRNADGTFLQARKLPVRV